MESKTIVAICIKVSTLVVGCSLNAYHLVRLLRKPKTKRSTFSFLHANLLITNILVLVLYNTSSITWFVSNTTFRDVYSCKTIHTLVAFSFHAVSNIVVVIAIERTITFFSPLQPKHHQHLKSSTKLLTVLAWAAAVLEASPQGYVFTSYTNFGQGVTDCTTIFRKERLHDCVVNYLRNPMLNFTELTFVTHFDNCMATVSGSEQAYGIAHLLAIFWLPFLAIGALHIAIIIRIRQLDKARFINSARHCRRNNTISRRITAIMLCYIASWSPYNFCALVEILFQDLMIGQYFTWTDILTDLMTINCIASPLLYRISV